MWERLSNGEGDTLGTTSYCQLANEKSVVRSRYEGVRSLSAFAVASLGASDVGRKLDGGSSGTRSLKESRRKWRRL